MFTLTTLNFVIDHIDRLHIEIARVEERMNNFYDLRFLIFVTILQQISVFQHSKNDISTVKKENSIFCNIGTSFFVKSIIVFHIFVTGEESAGFCDLQILSCG